MSTNSQRSFENEADKQNGDVGLEGDGTNPTSATLTSIHPIATPAIAEQRVIAQPRDLKFWMCFVALILPTFLIALDIAAVSTPLPIIVRDLHGREFEWVGSAYALASTAFQPLCGGFAQVFGRRIVTLTQIFLFAVGSAVCGAAPDLNVFILGRCIQGIGAGGIAAMGLIIMGDLVPLKERGAFNGFFVIAYASATAIAPVVGGALGQQGQWRWLFYLNLPICGLSAIIALVFLNLKTPPGTFREKILRLDWVGHTIIMGSTTACVIGLTWGGVEFPWSSPRVLVPLILGIVGIVAFVVYEAFVPKEPLVPFIILSNRTALSGYIQTFLTSFILISTIYYLPVYYQACKGASPIASGVDAFGFAQVITPFGFISGVLITKTTRYRPQIWLAWLLVIVAYALFTTLDADSGRAKGIGFQVIAGVAVGTLVPSAVFPVLSSLPVSCNAPALAFYMFLRYFAQIWGIPAGGAAIQNRLTTRLPPAFIERFPQGTSVAYSIIPIINQLDEPLRTQVREAFAEGLRVEWIVLTAVAGLGFLVSLAMKGLPLHTYVDENWTLENDKTGRAKGREGEQGQVELKEV